MVYDVTEEKSFDSVQKWLKEIDAFAGVDVVKLLVGNKIDLESDRVVTTLRGRNFAESLGVPFLETSAKDNSNVFEAFQSLALQVMGKTKK